MHGYIHIGTESSPWLPVVSNLPTCRETGIASYFLLARGFMEIFLHQSFMIAMRDHSGISSGSCPRLG